MLSLFSNVLNSSLKDNLTTIVGISSSIYILKNMSNYILNILNNFETKKQIKFMIKEEIQSLSKNNYYNNLKEIEKVYFLFFKIQNQYNKIEINKFNDTRKRLFYFNDIDCYIPLVENYINQSKIINNIIIDILLAEFNLLKHFENDSKICE